MEPCLGNLKTSVALGEVEAISIWYRMFTCVVADENHADFGGTES